ncbi:hypothetical protein [Variovorax sp. J22R115]|uniref:hypothetical protein n=1 Tax=Variovorax sp. J22R115 TaxID=3053509 RepID=UPI002576B01F|nr:hypothetical protein [Variovorax sp. J22R115]MDM0047907.1 hypothetical protein [Variovorax sp. J22R115]
MSTVPRRPKQSRTRVRSAEPGLPMGAEANIHWTVVRRRVSVAGRVARRDGSPVSSGVVQLRHEASVQAQTGVPERAGSRGSARADAAATATTTAQASAFETQIRRDGLYFYLDVPAGRYVLGGHDQGGGLIESRAITVPVADRARMPPLLDVDLVVEDAEGPPAGRPP